jgi:U3 small nucleolar ribonucleoprotein component
VLVLIDESGDCGLKFGKGSSDYFTCVAVVFSDEFSMSACDRTIDGLKMEIKKLSSFEFHFASTSDKIRRLFLERVSHDSFRYAGFVVDKRRLYGNRFRNPKEFYEASVGYVCEHVKPLLHNAKIIIDKNGDRAFRQQLEKRLKAQMTDKDGTCRIRKVAMETSHSNNLLQLADMICGAVMRSYNSSDSSFRELVKKREKFVQLWPRASVY